MRKEQEQLLASKLSAFDSNKLSIWLENSFKDYLSGDSEKMKVSFGGYGEETDSYNALLRVYENFTSDSSKSVFCTAVKDTLLSAIDNKLPYEAIHNLMCSAIHTQSSEILETFPILLAKSESNLKQNIAAVAISVLYNLPSSETTYEMTKQIVDDPAIEDDGWLFEAMDIFAKYKPEKTLPIINNYLPRLEKIAIKCDRIADEEQRLSAYRFINYCVLEVVDQSPQEQRVEVVKTLGKFIHKENVSQS